MKIVAVVGARPNFIKIASIAWAVAERDDVEMYLVHTGQHYDERMSKVFFEELEIPLPDIDLGVGSGSHAEQTADVMKKFEPVLMEQHPDVVLVVGDVNSTLACSITAVKLGFPVAHVEAGLRSFDETMPEEINRRITDCISRWLFVSEPSGLENLQREGVASERIFFVGNVMIDTLLARRPIFEQSRVVERLGLANGGYALLTMHRPSNVDDGNAMCGFLDAMNRIAERLPIVFPVHPRTRSRLVACGMNFDNERIQLVEPLGYIDFLKLQMSAKMVLTDSGGIQEETTALGVPCLTMRNNTERPVTVTQGTNRLVGTNPDELVKAAFKVLEGPQLQRSMPEKWDGNAARRIIDVLTLDVSVAYKMLE
jgi:UDP-N-acetylglucosamine 2-epimerase (non-hydrolysing)